MTLHGTKKPEFVWTDERVLVLKQLVVAGFTMSAIAQKLGVSRNAVIGKYHRVQADEAGAKANDGPRKAGKPAASVRDFKPRDQAGPRVALEEQRRKRPDYFANLEAGSRLDLSRYRCEESEPVRLMELRTRQCRFPLEDWQTKAGLWTLFCGAATETETGSWCPAHARLVTPAGAGTRSELSAEKTLRRSAG